MGFRRGCVKMVVALLLGATPPAALAFDLEDYAGTYRETRSAMLKAANEVRLAHSAYMQVRDYAIMHGWDPQDEAWFMTPGLLSGSCEALPNVAFGTDLDKASGEYQQLRNSFRVLTKEAIMGSRPPMPSLANQCSSQSYITDFEDLLSDLRATRDAYLKAIGQYELALPTYKAALAAYTAAMRVYTYAINCDPGPFLDATPRP